MSEYHISSLIVHTSTRFSHLLKENLELIQGTEIYAADELGKFIVVIEARTREELLRIYEMIRSLPHVLATIMVFHQVENEATELH